MSTITLSLRTKNSRSRLFRAILFLLHIPCALPAAQSDLRPGEPLDPFLGARRVMIERDLKARGIKDARVLAAMEWVPRQIFVAEKFRSSAYEDRPLPIGEGQTISQPYIVAYMTELLELKGADKVLEIGTGSGYQTAVLARLAGAVFTIEIIEALSERARAPLAELGLTNIQFKVGDGFFGWRDNAPFDAILLTAASPKIPEPLWAQLSEGGRIIMPLGNPRHAQKLVRIRKRAGKEIVETLSEVVFVPLTGAIQRSR